MGRRVKQVLLEEPERSLTEKVVDPLEVGRGLMQERGTREPCRATKRAPRSLAIKVTEANPYVTGSFFPAHARTPPTGHSRPLESSLCHEPHSAFLSTSPTGLVSPS